MQKEITNAELLEMSGALQQIAGEKLPGRRALQIARVAKKIEMEAAPLEDTRGRLGSRVKDEEDELTDEQAEEEWQDVLQDTVTIDLPELADDILDHLEIPAGLLFALEMLFPALDDEAE